MTDHAQAEAYARDWVDCWNRHDIPGVLAHFADDVVFTSPGAARVIPSSGGTVRGKAALADYWNRAMSVLPDLHFTLVGVYSGIDVMVINYRNQRGQLVNEVLRFDDDGLVVEGHGVYQPIDGAGASG